VDRSAPNRDCCQIEDLTTKSLCERHNSELSPLDDAVIDTGRVVWRQRRPKKL